MRRALIGGATAPDIHVMSWNIRRRATGPWVRPADGWRGRAPRIAAVLAAERPTVLCAQEVLPAQARALHDALGAHHLRIGDGRGRGGRGEGSPLFYDASRLELLDAEVSALSDTPDVLGSRSWGNPFARVLVHARFRDRATKTTFVVIGTHLDPFSARSRCESATAIARIVSAASDPVIVAGDFNADVAARSLQPLFADGMLRDSWPGAAARRTPGWATYAGYRRPRRGGHRIDAILVSAGVSVGATAIDGRSVDGGWPSDHLPVHALVRIDPT